MTKTAPSPALDFGITAEQVAQITDEIIAAELAVNDQVAALKPEEQTYENIVVPLARISNELSGNIILHYVYNFLLTRISFRQGTTR